MAFDDGTPLDAAALQALDTKLNEIRSSIPKIGTSATNTNGVNNQTAVQSQIIGGLTKNFAQLRPGDTVSMDISWETTLTAKPVAVILSPAKSNNEPIAAVSYAVDTTTVSTTGCKVNIYLEAGSKPYSTKFYWLVLAAG